MFIYSMYIFPYLHDEYTSILVYSLASKQPSLPSLSPSPISYRSKSLSVKATLLALKVRSNQLKTLHFPGMKFRKFETMAHFLHHSVYQSLTLNFQHHRIIKIIRNLWPNPPKPPSSRMVQNHQSNGCPQQWPPHLERLKWPECFAPFARWLQTKKWAWKYDQPTGRKLETFRIDMSLSLSFCMLLFRMDIWGKHFGLFFDFFLGYFLSCRETLEKLFGKTGGIGKKSPHTVHFPLWREPGPQKQSSHPPVSRTTDMVISRALPPKFRLERSSWVAKSMEFVGALHFLTSFSLGLRRHQENLSSSFNRKLGLSLSPPPWTLLIRKRANHFSLSTKCLLTCCLVSTSHQELFTTNFCGTSCHTVFA